MPRVLILSLLFPPDNVSTAHIMGDLAVDLRDAGYDVQVVTSTPHYNRDADAESRQPLARSGFLFSRSSFHGIPVIHARVGKKSRSVLRRLLSWCGFHLLTTAVALRGPRPDVILCPSPPPTIALTAWVIGLRHRAPFIYNVQEIYPDIAISLGAVRNRALIAALFALERFIYRKAAAVTVIGPGLESNLLAKGVPKAKLHVIPNFVDLDLFTPQARENAFAREHGLGAKFVVSYAGNMGPAQGLETFIDAAALLRDESGIVFLMIGDGILRDDLRARARALPNLIFLDHQPLSLVPSIYAASDMNLVPLAAGAGANSIPSKVYRIMAAERPILACADADSELARLVHAAACGEVVPPGDAPALAETVRRAARETEQGRAMGRRGREYVLQHYARKNVTRRYAELIGQLSPNPA